MLKMMPPSVSPLRLARRPAAVLLALVAALALLMSGGDVDTADAQDTNRVLVSNLERPTATSFTLSTGAAAAQAFTTGSSQYGYLLTSVHLKMGLTSSQTVPTVTLRSGSATGTVLATLTGAATTGTTVDVEFRAPDPVWLGTATTYWIRVEGGGGGLWETTANGEDAGSAAGWSIADGSQTRATATASFVDEATNSLQVQVNGNIVPAPSMLVSNVFTVTDGNSSTTDGRTSVVTQGFTTGGFEHGYRLYSVDLRFETFGVTTPPTVTLHSGSASGPVVTTFSGPASLDANADKQYTFTAPGIVTLVKNTQYWIKVAIPTGGAMNSARYLVHLNHRTTEEEASAEGWSIADTLGGTIYETNPVRMRLNGYNNPGAITLLDNFLEGETPVYESLADFDISQRFTAGVGSGQFTLSSIEVNLRTGTDTVTPTMKLFSGSAQGTEVATLSGPAALDASTTKDYSFIPTTDVTLTARTQYWIFLEGGQAEVARANLDSFRREQVAEPGWTSEDLSYTRAHDSTDDFVSFSPPIPFRVKGNVVDLPAADATGQPSITAPNVYRVPAVLMADPGTILDDNGIVGIEDSITYTWQRFDATGTTLEMGNIGTGTTYTLTGADAGKTLKVVASFTDDDGTMEGPLTSAATPQIVAAATCAAPSYAGGEQQIWTGTVAIERAGFANQTEYGYANVLSTFGGGVDYGFLDDTDFTSLTSYDIATSFLSSVTGEPDVFSFRFVAPNAAASSIAEEYPQWTLYACSKPLFFRLAQLDSHLPSDPTLLAFQVEWPNPGLDWSTHAQRTLYLTRDQVAPTLTSARVSGTELTLTFSEDLGAAVRAVGPGSETAGGRRVCDLAGGPVRAAGAGIGAAAGS